MKDLVVLVADRNMEFAIRGILRQATAIGVRVASVDVYVHPERDPGCLLKGHEFLRAFHRSHLHGLIMFDREGCGRERQTRESLEAEVERRLSGSGWEDRGAAVAIDPELESWVWSDSEHVDAVLGWGERVGALRRWLRATGYLQEGADKPRRPKEAVEAALRLVRKPRSSSLYGRLAELVDLGCCSDEAFGKLRRTLESWFPSSASE